MTRARTTLVRMCVSIFLVKGMCVGLAAGCGGATRYVDIDSKPTGAVIFVDGERRGLTRTKVQFDFGDSEKRVLIQILKPRYKPVLQYWTEGEIPEDEKKVFLLDPE